MVLARCAGDGGQPLLMPAAAAQLNVACPGTQARVVSCLPLALRLLLALLPPTRLLLAPQLQLALFVRALLLLLLLLELQVALDAPAPPPPPPAGAAGGAAGDAPPLW